MARIAAQTGARKAKPKRVGPPITGTINKKLIAKVSGTTKGEVRGVVHGPKPKKRLLEMSKGGPTAGVKRGSKAAVKATKMVKKAYR